MKTDKSPQTECLNYPSIIRITLDPRYGEYRPSTNDAKAIKGAKSAIRRLTRQWCF